MEKKYEISQETYRNFIKMMYDFENSTDDELSEDWMSDGQWLDRFYDMCKVMLKEIQNENKEK